MVQQMLHNQSLTASLWQTVKVVSVHSMAISYASMSDTECAWHRQTCYMFVELTNLEALSF